jgi:hypothetical protein
MYIKKIRNGFDVNYITTNCAKLWESESKFYKTYEQYTFFENWRFLPSV